MSLEGFSSQKFVITCIGIERHDDESVIFHRALLLAPRPLIRPESLRVRSAAFAAIAAQEPEPILVGIGGKGAVIHQPLSAGRDCGAAQTVGASQFGNGIVAQVEPIQDLLLFLQTFSPADQERIISHPAAEATRGSFLPGVLQSHPDLPPR